MDVDKSFDYFHSGQEHVRLAARKYASRYFPDLIFDEQSFIIYPSVNGQAYNPWRYHLSLDWSYRRAVQTWAWLLHAYDLELRSDQVVFDIGFGQGGSLLFHLEHNQTVIGFEKNKIPRKVQKKVDEGLLTVHQGDVCDTIPIYEDNIADIIVCYHMGFSPRLGLDNILGIEYIKKIIIPIAEKIKPIGHLVISSDFLSIETLLQQLGSYDPTQPTHPVVYFTGEAIKELALDLQNKH